MEIDFGIFGMRGLFLIVDLRGESRDEFARAFGMLRSSLLTYFRALAFEILRSDVAYMTVISISIS